jgi:hypothetical protein
MKARITKNNKEKLPRRARRNDRGVKKSQVKKTRLTRKPKQVRIAFDYFEQPEIKP